MKDPAEFLNNRRFIATFSGGKDSLATLLWILDNIKHDNFKILYIEIPGNTHPLCTQYVRNVCKQLGVYNKLIVDGRYDLEFFECLRKWGIPVIGIYRWCLWQFKVKVFEKHLSYSLIQVSGVRREDSRARAKLGLIEIHRLFNAIIVNPIINWTRRQVLNYIREHGVPLNPCYKIYGHSGNCMFCPYHDKKAIRLTMQDPEWRNKIISALRHCKAPLGKKTLRRWMKFYNKSLLGYINA